MFCCVTIFYRMRTVLVECGGCFICGFVVFVGNFSFLKISVLMVLNLGFGSGSV